MSSDIYLITLVFHAHTQKMDAFISDYVARPGNRNLPDVPFHMVDLIHGHGDYSHMSPAQRKPILYAFATFVRTLPVAYVTLRFNASDTGGRPVLEARIRQSIADYIFAHLERFQTYDEVAVYYDGGSPVVGKAVRAAFDFALARNVANYRRPVYAEHRLLQVADYLTSIELAAIRYEQGKQSKSYERFFGTRQALRRNLLKAARKLKAE